MKKLALLTAASACLIHVSPSDARPPHPPGPGGPWPMFEQMLDQDQDGRISEQEFSSLVGTFNKLDADDDGYLTPEDFQAMEQRRQLGHHLVRLADQDRDHSVTLQEWDTMVGTLDSNGDGSVSGQELVAKMEGQGGPRGRKRGPRPEGRPAPGDEDGPEGEFGPGPRGEFGPGPEGGPEGEFGPGPRGEFGPGRRGEGGPRGHRQGRRGPGGPMGLDGVSLKASDLAGLFDEMDRNGDGILNQEDRPARPEGRRGPRPQGKRPE